jgi:hypothetical protein
VALAAVHAVEVGSHEEARPALRADLAQALHLASIIHLVELKHTQLDLLVLVLDLLGLGVGLLLALLTATQEAKGGKQLGVISHSAGSQGGSVLQDAAGESDGDVLSSQTCV